MITVPYAQNGKVCIRLHLKWHAKAGDSWLGMRWKVEANIVL